MRAQHSTMTVAVKNKPPVVVPAAALRRAGFKRGQVLEVKSAEGVVTIVPKAEDYTPAQRRAIDLGIAQSRKEFAAGLGSGPFATVEEFLGDLHREVAKLDAKKRKRSGK